MSNNIVSVGSERVNKSGVDYVLIGGLYSQNN